MDNKLGLSDNDLELYENKIFDFMSSMLDEKITFNVNEFNLDYLKRLHSFLFGAVYDSAGKLSNRYNESDFKDIDNKIKEVVDMIFYELDASFIVEKINEIINMQIFEDGNNRTIKTFFRHIISMYKSNNIEYMNELLNNINNMGKSL